MRLFHFTDLLLSVLLYYDIRCEASFINFTYANCQTTVLCSGFSTTDEGYCIIWYRKNTTYTQDFSPPINGSINSLITLPQMLPKTSYSLHVLVLISNSTTVEIFENVHTTGEYDDRLTLANKVVLIVGAILWTLAAILTAILSVLQLKLINERYFRMYRLSRMFVTCSSVTMFLSLLLWVTLALLVTLQTNTCDPVWKMCRDGIVFSTLILSFISITFSIISAVLLTISFHHVITMVRRHPSIIHREELVMEQCEVFAYSRGREDFIIKANPLYGSNLSAILSKTINSAGATEATDTFNGTDTCNGTEITGQCNEVIRNKCAM